MDDISWIIWVILGVAFIIAEMFTPGFVLLWFGVAALAAGFVDLMGLGYPLQFLVFIVFSVLLTAASRTLFSSYLHTGGVAGLKTGVDSLPGKIGTVVHDSSGALREGAVKVFGSVWTAYPAEGEEPLKAGEKVVVENVEGASIIVRRADSNPSWRQPELKE
jgi:inner membrane protein